MIPKKKPRRGRPKIANPRNRLIIFRIDEEEWTETVRLAGRMGPHRWVRNLLMKRLDL